MRVAVFGAMGRTGRLVVAELRGAGHEAVAVSRRGEAVEGAQALRANPATGEGMAAVEGCDAVINAMASGKGNPACSALALALSGRDLRYVTVAGAAVDAPGDAKGVADRVVSWLGRRIGGAVVLDRQEELAILQASRLGWTMLRPPRLVDGPPKGPVRVAFDRPQSLSITRADLAAAAARALEDGSLMRRAPFVSN